MYYMFAVYIKIFGKFFFGNTHRDCMDYKLKLLGRSGTNIFLSKY